MQKQLELAPRSSGRLATRPPLPSTMLERPGPLLRFIFRRFFAPIAFAEDAVQRIRRAAEQGTVVYVLRATSYIEYLYFNHALAAHGLPLARFANGVRTLLWQTLGSVWAYLAAWLRGDFRRTDEATLLVDHVSRGESALWFLSNPRRFIRHRVPAPPIAEALLQLERERAPGDPPVVLVPLALIWGRPKRETAGPPTLLDVVFGEREAPGRLREAVRFLRHFRNAFVKVGEPVALDAFVAAEAAGAGRGEGGTVGGAADSVLARRLRWTVSGAIERELRVALGPRRKSAARVRSEVLRRRQLHEAAREIARDEGKPVEALLARAAELLREMSADMRPGYIAAMRVAFEPILRRLYDGIEVDQAGLERVREAARRGPLLLLPSHKSHLDYLVLSYVFYKHELVPPHIAAGINLAFWPMGHIFRRTGAFFIRRTVKGDPLYQIVLREYMRALLRAGHHIEFFVEGTRSRSGKLLAPKAGLLGMIADALLDGDLGKDGCVQCVPISIGYEKIVEARSYAEERLGAEKRKEDFGALLRARRVFGTRYGRINVQFDTPFDLGDALRAAGAGDLPGDPGAEAAERRAAVRRVCYRIVDGINRVSALTPTSLAALALLGRGTRGITRGQLGRALDLLVRYAELKDARLSQPLRSELAASRGERRQPLACVEHAIDLLARDGDVDIVGELTLSPDTVYYRVPEERRVRLDYYKNAAIHVFADAALVAAALLLLEPPGAAGKSGRYAEPVPLAALREKALALSRLLKLELVFGTGSPESLFEGTLGRLAELGAVMATPAGAPTRVRVTQALRGELTLLGGLVRELLEAYHIVARVVLEAFDAAHPAGGAAASAHVGGRELEEREWLARAMALGERALALGEITRREALSRTTLQNALALAAERGALVARSDGKKGFATGERQAAEALASELRSVLPSPYA